jgi:amidase
MDRRRFLQNSSAAGIAVSAGIPFSKNNGGNSRSWQEGYDPETFTDAFLLNELSIDDLQSKMKAGEFTSGAITELYLKRIRDIDKAGPDLNAVIELNPDALRIADGMDRERTSGIIRGPLHGIPVLVKDNIDTGDQMMTTAGSVALEGHKAEKDAFIIQKLRKAGAVLLGKTNMSEWANWRSTRSTSGWSSRGGQTRNPYILDRNPTGSSSGSGVAVAANLCPVAIGTETDGSIIGPSSFNGIVGMKPTVGLLSRSGIIPISGTQDTAGPMTKTVRDTALLLTALSGTDPEDPETLANSHRTYQDYTQGLDLDGLKGKKIGVEKYTQRNHEGVIALYQEAIEIMKCKGAVIVEVELLKVIREASLPEFTVLMFEFKDGINKYFSRSKTRIKSLAELIEFNKQNEKTAMPYFKQERLESCESKGGLDSAEYREALSKTLTSREIITGLMKDNQLDALCGITSGPACCIDLINGDYGTGYYYGSPAAMSGYPHITVPMGLVFKLPVGLSFISEAYTEQKLLNIAFAFEQATKKRTPPKFIPGTIPESNLIL